MDRSIAQHEFVRRITRYLQGSSIRWHDLADVVATAPSVGRIPGDPLQRLGITPADLDRQAGPSRFVAKTQYLNGARAVVTHSVDDATEHLPACLDAMDRYGIKATAFVNTHAKGIKELWPRLRQAVANGHEIGSHSRRHPCRLPETAVSCFRTLTRYEIDGSRDDILEQTTQPHVWSWAYPCGKCSARSFIQKKIARAEYVTARAYPGELQGQYLVPNLQTYDANPYAARYTQVVQNSYTKRYPGLGEVSFPARNELEELNRKFDEVHAGGGIYSFVSHPQMVDQGPNGFYEQHMAYVGRRSDIWYVPMGPLYAYRTLMEQTSVLRLKSRDAVARFAVVNQLDSRIYNGSLSFEFEIEQPSAVMAHGAALTEWTPGTPDLWDRQYFRRLPGCVLVTTRPNTIVEFR